MPEFYSTVRYAVVEGFPGYMVGTDGSIWSCRKIGAKPGLGDKWRRLKPWRGTATSYPYLKVNLCQDGKVCTREIHRIVLETFVGPRPDGMVACHSPDREKTNCNLDNLRWDTRLDNFLDAVTDNTASVGEKMPTAKLKNEWIPIIRKRYASGEVTQSQLGREYGVSRRVIGFVVNYRTYRFI